MSLTVVSFSYAAPVLALLATEKSEGVNGYFTLYALPTHILPPFFRGFYRLGSTPLWFLATFGLMGPVTG